MRLRCLTVLGLCLLLSLSLAAQERRAFDPGGPETLVKVGQTSHSKLMSAEATGTSFSFTTKELYDVTLYLDEEGARTAFAPFRGKDLDAVSSDEKFQKLVAEADFPKLVVLSFSYKGSARDLREDFSEELGKQGAKRDAGKFVNYFRKDYEPGDEVIIRIAPGGRVATSVNGESKGEIQSPALARALLSMWMGRQLVADIGPLLE